MKCKKCSLNMSLDDRDDLLRGLRHLYWLCPHCDTSCTEIIYYGKRIRVDWFIDDDVLISYGSN